MSKQETIKKLADIIGVIVHAYMKGRDCGSLNISESPNPDSTAIGFSLYADNKPVCEGLERCPIIFDDGTSVTGCAFAIWYDPDDEENPIEILYELDDEDSTELGITPNELPAETLTAITQWIENQLPKDNGQKNPLLVCKTETLEALHHALCEASNQMQGDRTFREAAEEPVFLKMSILCNLVLKAIAAKSLNH